MTGPAEAATPTPSLQRRVTVIVLGLLVLLLLILGVVIDVRLGVQARRSMNDRLVAATVRADALAAAHTPPAELAADLNGAVVRALVVTADGATYGDPAIQPDTATGPITALPPLGTPPAPPTPASSTESASEDTATAVVHPLLGGGRVILVADTTQTTQVTRELRELMIVTGLATLGLAAVLLTLASRAALHPLDRLTRLADAITTGDRGRRLRPDRAHTELGRAASAFDAMLNALEASEHRAQQAAANAQRAEAATRRFLADAAHELRTPITGIQAAAEQLAHNASRDDADPAALRQYRRAGLLLSDARRATRLVTDMLDLSRIDAGLPLQLQDTDLAGIVDAEADRATALAPELIVTRTGSAAMPVSADPTRIAQILSNLLDNARRHAPPGGSITLDVQRCGDLAAVTVTDTGPGIPDGECDHVFERLVRLDTGRARDHGGAGLGLPIARALARAHAGELTCVPHRGGARFRLTLPIGAPADPQR